MITLRDHWQDQGAWDAFVEKHEESRFCDLAGYGEALACYGYRTNNICFLRDDTIVAALPATEAYSVFFGRKLVSQPFSEYGGLLLDPQLEEPEIVAVVALLKGYTGKQSPYNTVEIHGNHGVPASYRDTLFVAKNPHTMAYIKLDQSAAVLWQDVINYEARKAINKAKKSGVIVEEECNHGIIEKYFFPMYLASMKRLGVPPHTIGYYRGCFELLGRRMKLLWAKKGTERIAGLLGLSSGHRVSLINTVSDPSYWQYRPNDLLHWEFLLNAKAEGYTYFDFGSVRYDGQKHFKKKWGCTLQDHKYYFVASDQNVEQPRTFDTSSSFLGMFSNLWAQYVPTALGRRLGPPIRRLLVR